MTTTIRSSRSGLDSEGYSYGGVDLLTRRETEVPSVQPETNETEEQKRTRMRQNLERLMNFGREDTATVVDEVAVSEETKAEGVSDTTLTNEIVDMSDEDIRPTSTTMQFGNDGKETVLKDMEKQKDEAAYKLNGKGKLVVFLYALAVVVVLALIILNTGVLSVLSQINSAKAETLAQKQGEAAAIYNEIEEVSSDEYVIRLAEEELHMTRG